MMLQRLKLLFDRLWAALACPGGVHYVSGAQSLPPPLTPEEEKQLLARMMAGDAAARDELITHNLRLVVYLAKKYESSGVPQEDMISIGTIGLRGAAEPPGAADHGAALRPRGRRGAHPERGRRRHRHQPELHFPAGKAHHPRPAQTVRRNLTESAGPGIRRKWKPARLA